MTRAVFKRALRCCANRIDEFLWPRKAAEIFFIYKMIDSKAVCYVTYLQSSHNHPTFISA